MSPEDTRQDENSREEEVEEDVVLAAEDVDEVLEDDGLKPDDDMEEDLPADHEPMIKNDGDEEGKPSNACGGTCK